MPNQHTFATLCTRLNRSPVYVRGLQRRFGLPIHDGAIYTAAYETFLETLIHLRILGISVETLLRLWHLERKLMQLLHADSTGSPTWFLDACGANNNPDHRLLLSNFDIGVFLPVFPTATSPTVPPQPPDRPPARPPISDLRSPPSAILQLGLNFAQDTTELFSKSEMGEDAILVLRQYLPLHQQILREIYLEHPIVHAALRHFPAKRPPAPQRKKPKPANKPDNATLIPDEI